MNEKLDFTADDIERIFANPYYCLPNWTTCGDRHPALCSEDVWVRAGAKLIKEIGAEKYLRHLLENLKGNYVIESSPK